MNKSEEFQRVISINTLEGYKEGETYPILALGHPRGGTRFAARLLTAIGLPVGHECFQSAGTSNWQLSPVHDFTFRRIIHVLRDPLNVIQSAARTLTRRSKQYLLYYTKPPEDLNHISAMAYSFLRWHELIEKRKPAHKIRVEVEQDWMYLELFLMKNHLLQKIRRVDRPHKKINGRKYKPFTDEEWDSIPTDLMKEIQDWREQYGYK